MFFFAGVLTLVPGRPRTSGARGGTVAPVARAEAGEPRRGHLRFEDLVAYHLWFALSTEPRRFDVSVLKGTPGIPEDPAYFLPRGFREVGVNNPGALDGERFWVAFRAAALNESRPPLKLLVERGYQVERVFETTAQGQRAFLVLVARARQ